MKGLLHQQLTLTSLPSLLRYEDTDSMAHSIESRVPFLTLPIVQFVLSLPEEYIISPDGTTKSVFREAMRGIVPQAILDRRDKIGFATPEQSWMRTLQPWVESVLHGDAARMIPALNQAGVEAEWKAMLDGKIAFDWRFWRWVNLIRWTELNNISFS